MMFPMEKCAGRTAHGNGSEGGIFAGGSEGMVKEGVLSDEVASAVAAVSDEIGDILKDELDSGRADRIGAELADLSAELGLLAGLADGDQPQDFPSLFEIAVSTSTWRLFSVPFLRRFSHGSYWAFQILYFSYLFGVDRCH